MCYYKDMTSEQTDEAEDILATLANMRKYAHVKGIVALDPLTGEEFSANAADYYSWMTNDACLTSSIDDDEPCVLVVKRSRYMSVDERGAHVAYCTGPTGRHLLTADEAKDMLANSPFRVWRLSDDVEILDENEVTG